MVNHVDPLLEKQWFAVGLPVIFRDLIHGLPCVHVSSRVNPLSNYRFSWETHGYPRGYRVSPRLPAGIVSLPRFTRVPTQKFPGPRRVPVGIIWVAAGSRGSSLSSRGFLWVTAVPTGVRGDFLGKSWNNAEIVFVFFFRRMFVSSSYR